MTIRFGLGPIPIGFAFVVLSDRGIRGLFLLDQEDPVPGLARLRATLPCAPLVEDRAAVAHVLHRAEAFVSRGQGCEDLALDLHGTPFQHRVWEALRSIPIGSTCTYGELARRLGAPGAARAVGAACGANPVALLVPCHRTVGAGGDLGGYRWGLERKRGLLERERQWRMTDEG